MTRRASYQQQYEAAVSALQAQQASGLADVAALNRYLHDLGLPAQQQTSRPGTPAQQQQQQQHRQGPMQELVARLQGVRAALEARAAAQRTAQQQLEAQVRLAVALGGSGTLDAGVGAPSGLKLPDCKRGWGSSGVSGRDSDQDLTARH